MSYDLWKPKPWDLPRGVQPVTYCPQPPRPADGDPRGRNIPRRESERPLHYIPPGARGRNRHQNETRHQNSPIPYDVRPTSSWCYGPRPAASQPTEIAQPAVRPSEINRRKRPDEMTEEDFDGLRFDKDAVRLNDRIAYERLGTDELKSLWIKRGFDGAAEKMDVRSVLIDHLEEDDQLFMRFSELQKQKEDSRSDSKKRKVSPKGVDAHSSSKKLSKHNDDNANHVNIEHQLSEYSCSENEPEQVETVTESGRPRSSIPELLSPLRSEIETAEPVTRSVGPRWSIPALLSPLHIPFSPPHRTLSLDGSEESQSDGFASFDSPYFSE